MNARINLSAAQCPWLAIEIALAWLVIWPSLCLAQVSGRPASETYVTSKINAHASTNNAHADIRAQVFAATTNVNALTIAATNATEAAHAATVQANAAILKNTQQDADISYLYASNANVFAIANMANTRAQAANVTNAQNGAAIASVSNLTVTAQNTANAAVGGVTAVSNLVIGVKALNENAITNETDRIALQALATNRVTAVFNPTNANEWTDGTGGKWRVDIVYSNFWRVTASEIGFTNDFSSTNPLPIGSLTSVNDGDIALTAELFYDAQGENPYISILLNAMSFNMSWTGGYFEGDVASSITLDPYFGPTIPATLVWTSVPMSVTSRVDTVALKSDLPSLTNGLVHASDKAWITSEADAAALAALATNRVTRWYASETNWLEYVGLNSIREYTVTQASVTVYSIWFDPENFSPRPSVTAFPFYFSAGDGYLVGWFDENGCAKIEGSFPLATWESASSEFPQTLYPSGEGAAGTAVVSQAGSVYVPVTNTTEHSFPTAIPLYIETWSYDTMTNWMSDGNAGQVWVSSLASDQATTAMNAHTASYNTDPHAGRYPQITNGVANNISLTGAVTIGGETRTNWPVSSAAAPTNCITGIVVAGTTNSPGTNGVADLRMLKTAVTRTPITSLPFVRSDSGSATNLTVLGPLIFVPITIPNPAPTGSIYFSSADAHFYGYDGSQWKQLDN